MEIICMEKQTFDELVVRLSLIEKKVIGICSQTKDAGLKKWMDNQEVCGILRPEDVQSLLESSYHPQKRKP